FKLGGKKTQNVGYREVFLYLFSMPSNRFFVARKLRGKESETGFRRTIIATASAQSNAFIIPTINHESGENAIARVPGTYPLTFSTTHFFRNRPSPWKFIMT